MYKIGDFIVYGSNGVCQIEKIGPMDSPVIPKDKLYYTLHPHYVKGSTIFTPVDNQKVVMRPVLTKEAALELVNDIRNIDMLWIGDEKKREQQYKEAFRTCDCRELVKIIKTIYIRRQSRLAEGKKVTTQDEKYFRMAEDALYGELAISLGMSREETKQYVIERVSEQEESED